MPNLSTKDGTPTGGVYGFAVLALEVVKRLDPDYVCVAWDKAKTNIRSRIALYPQYKANRKAPPPDFYEQIPLLRNLLDALGWPLYEADDFEADDLMGAFARQAGEQGVESFLVTSDLDVLQLVNEHTHIYTLKKGLSSIELFDQTHFREKYGIEPTQWVDVKALKGDSSDNVPGVAGVGEKTALQLISEYGSLEGVYENVELLKPTLRDKLLKDKDMAYLSKTLVTLITDAPIEISLTDAQVTDGVSDEFVAMLKKLEFRSLLREVEASRLHSPDSQPTTLPTAKEASFDIGLIPPDKLRLLDISDDSGSIIVSTEHGVWSSVDISTLTQRDVDVIANGPTIGHDLKRVFRALLSANLEWRGVVAHDTRIVAFLLNALERSRDLSDLLDQKIDTNEHGQVVAAIWKLYAEQQTALDGLPQIRRLANEIELPSIYLLAKMEHRGIKLDSSYLGDMSQRFEKKIGALERNIYAKAGKEFNISSPSQLAVVLYEDLELPKWGIKKGKNGYSTGARELAKLRHLHPIINLITEYREYTKLKSTYIDALPKLVDENGKLHTTFNLDVAATGRLSSNNPNLQNIPTRTDLGQAIRSAFVADEGNVFVSADYSQFELRLAAVMSDDKGLIEAFNDNLDVHTKTASEIYEVPMDKVTKSQRRNAKTINFAVLYGMSAHGLSESTGMSMVEAKAFIDKYFSLRKPVADYIEKITSDAAEQGYVETIFGRRRPTPDLRSSNYVVREAAKRAAANMPIQGTEADLMKIAMLRVEDELNNKNLGEQILQIHDSIMVECPKGNAKKVSELLVDIMENVYPELPISLRVDVHTADNWGDL